MGKLGPNFGLIMSPGQAWAIMAHGGPKFGPIMGPGQAWAHHGPRGAQVEAHNEPWASLSPSWPKGGPKFEPMVGPEQVWAHRGPWGAQVWAHNGPWASLATSWSFGRETIEGPEWALGTLGPTIAHGGPKFGPIMGPGQAWAPHGPWRAQGWAHNGPWASLGPA